ncbi:MAG: N-acetylmuramoyl-L-alanine amidase [Clostridia bacterium]|nr:N-acetylmuramoyl-L-alanine amidase [Clostridia bacterium]
MENKEKVAIISFAIISVLALGILITIMAMNARSVSVFSKDMELFEKIDLGEATLTQYTVYGTHFNLTIKIDHQERLKNISEAKILLRDQSGKDLEYFLDYNIKSDEILFTTSDNINTGINLEDIDVGKYYVVLKVTTQEIDHNNKITRDYYYAIVNQTEYDNITYYTITKGNSNNEVNLLFNEIPNKYITTLYIDVKSCKLPENVYDIVIDAGHGGADEGASGNGYIESEITLEYAELLKRKFERLGLKVKLTREENETRMDTYGEGGRYIIANEVKAKLQLSIHFNSSLNQEVSGVEIYSPNSSDLAFSQTLAKSLVEKAGASYSPNNVWKIYDGVYVRTFSDKEMEEMIEYANDYGFEPYDITSHTSYYGVIRESGGIMTGAYVDGRNGNFGDNPYWNSNVGVETYLLELGYITNKDEINNVLQKIGIYTDVIVMNTKEYLGI